MRLNIHIIKLKFRVMGLNKSGEIFLITGLLIFSIGYFSHIKNIGDMGVLFMISGSSLIIASFVELISKWIYLKF